MMARFRDVSISAKLTSLFVLVAAGALVLASVAFVTIDRIGYRAALQRRLSAEAQIIGANSTAAILFNDAAAGGATLSALAAEPHVVSGVIYDRSAGRFASYGEGRVDRILVGRLRADDSVENVTFDRGRMVLSRRILSDGETIGFVVLESDLADLDERLIWLITVAFAIVLATLVLAAGISSRLQRVISRPILELATVARLVSRESDYSVRASPGGRDETGLLVYAFNQMLGRIQQRESSLRAEIAAREKTQAELARARDAAEAARIREERARKAAEQASAVKSSFLANMSHEIRTPLNVILGYNSLIEAELAELGNASYKPLVDGVARASKRLMTTVHDILDISRIESGAFDIHPAPIQLAPFIERLVEDHRVLARNKGLELELVGAHDETVVVFDEYCLSHSLTNLLDNAVKFTETGKITVTLGRQSDGSVRIEVRDTGVGIDADYLPRIAEPFSQEQLGSTRKFEGSGLGLALTKRFLDTHGASLSVTSRKGEGASFVIHIPREWVLARSTTDRFAGAEANHAESNGGGADTNGASGRDPGDWAKPCVLVVEDDAETQEVMRLMLRERYRVVTAATGAEARRQLAFPGQSVRVVLMDLALRGDEDGLALTRSLRENERWRTLPIVAVTAHALSEDRERALRAGCDAYLSKPLERQRLLSIVQGFTR